MRKIRSVIAFLTALILFISISWTAAWLLMPVRTVYGSTWDHYRTEKAESIDLLFFGSSLAYCDIIPASIYEENGLRSYVVAGPEQTVPIMYYYVREACKTQTPQLVVCEVTNIFYKEYQNYTKANISYMPFGANRLAATFAAAEEDERFGLLFPLYNYHYRWTTVETAEISAHISPSADMTAGYTLLTESCETPVPTELDYSSNSDNYQRNIKYIAKLKQYCDNKNIELMLYITPSNGKIPPNALKTLKFDLQNIGAELYDLNENIDDIGLNNDTDWYDPLHFNVYGADKFSRFLAHFIAERYPIELISSNEEIWQNRIEYIRTALQTSDV